MRNHHSGPCAVLTRPHKGRDRLAGLGLPPGFIGHMDGPLRRGVGNDMDPQGVEQVAHQRPHTAVFNEVVEILQSKAGAQRRLIEAQLIANLLKGVRRSILHQSHGPVDQQGHSPGGGLGINNADLLLRVLFQHHVPGHYGGVICAGEIGGNGKTHRAVPSLESPGKRRRRGTRRRGGRLFRRHSRQHVGNHQLIIVDEFPFSHLDPQGDDLKPDGGILKRCHSQITAAVTHNVPNHNLLLIIWFCIPHFLLSYRTSIRLSMVKSLQPQKTLTAAAFRGIVI